MLIKIQDDGTTIYPYSIDEFASEHPDVGHMELLSDAFMAANNVHRLGTWPYDGATPITFNTVIEYADSPELIDGVWYIREVLRNLTDEEIAAKNQILGEQCRVQRNEALSRCDWTQLPDNQLSDAKRAEWTAYRQALRDITTDPNFPDMQNLVWPTEPA